MITKEELEQLILDITSKKTDREFIVMQGCLTYGTVTRSTSDLNLCNNKNCTSCQQYHESIKNNINHE